MEDKSLKVFVDNSFGKNILITVLTIPFSLILLLPLINTKYTLTDDQLIVHNGFYGSSIELVDITSITPTRNMASAPALSLDRIEIQYKDAHGNNSTLISPKDKQNFYGALQERDSNLKIKGSSLTRK